MKEKISILCPTRGRPELFDRMVLSAYDTADPRQFEILGYVDDDDPMKEAYFANGKVPFITGPSNGVGHAWNKLAEESNGTLLMMGNDDLVFQTVDWDKKLIEVVASLPWRDRIFVMWCDDGAPEPGNRCAFPIVSREWFRVLGYFAPECFHFLYHDTWVHELGNLLGRTYFVSNVVVEHRHFSFKKSEYDDTYRRHRVGAENSRKRNEDKNLFRDSVKVRVSDVRGLQIYIEDFKQLSRGSDG